MIFAILRRLSAESNIMKSRRQLRSDMITTAAAATATSPTTTSAVSTFTQEEEEK
jgi:hypothetical protein